MIRSASSAAHQSELCVCCVLCMPGGQVEQRVLDDCPGYWAELGEWVVRHHCLSLQLLSLWPAQICCGNVP